MPSYKASEPTARPDCVPQGEYTLEVIDAQEALSQRDHEMIELKLKVEPSGAILFDHLVFTPNAFWKIDAFRAAIGQKVVPDEDVELIADDLIGHRGRARLVIEEYQGRKRNKVAAWLLPAKPSAAPSNSNSTAKGGVADDDIPF